MASKKTITKKAEPKKPAKKAAPKKAPAARSEAAERKAAAPRHPKARVAELHGGKPALAKALAASLTRDDDDSAAIAERLRTASNAQLLRLHRIVDAVKAKWGSREALIAAIGTAENKSKDKDYLAKLGSFPLPRLYQLAISTQRRA